MTTADGCQALHYLASSAPTHLFYNVPIFISLMLDLVRAGADVNHQNRRGRSVLHELCRQENWTFCVAFLYFFPQADVNSMDMNGNTPLHMAVKANHPRLVEVLLNCGSFPDMIGFYFPFFSYSSLFSMFLFSPTPQKRKILFF